MLIRNIYTRLGSNIIRAGLSVISSIFIVRILGVEVIGKIAYYYGIIGMFTLFSDLGSGTAYMKFLASDDSHGQDIAGYFYIKTGLIAVFCLLAWGLYQWRYSSSSLDTNLFIIAFVATITDLISQLFTNTLLGHRKFVFLSKVEILGSSILFFYNIIICFLFPSLYLLALNMVIMPLCVIMGGIYYFYTNQLSFFEIPRKATLVKYFRYAYPLAFSSMVGLFSTHFEKVIIGRLIGMKELGFYRLALGIFSGFDKVIKPVTNTLFTELSFRVGKSADFIQTKFRDLVQTLNMFGGLLAILVIFGSRAAVEVFYGPDNIRAAVILQFFALSIISRLFWRPYRHILFAIEKHHPLAYLSLFEFLLRLGLYYLLIPLTLGGLLIGAIAMPLSEFILWVIPSGIYNITALLKRFETIHVRSIFFRIGMPLGLILLAGSFLNYSVFLLPVFLTLFLFMEYYLDVLTPERWNSLILPVRDFFGG